MKKVFLITILSAICLPSLNAQTEKGKFLIGSSSSLELMGSNTKYKSDADNYDESGPDKYYSINFTPKAGYFIADNFALGLNIDLEFSKYESGFNGNTTKESLYAVGPFLRYYIPTNSILPFIEAGGAFGTEKSKYETNLFDNDDKSSLLMLGAWAGIAVPIGEIASLDILAGYKYYRFKDKENNEDNLRTVVGTVELKVGFTIFLCSNE